MLICIWLEFGVFICQGHLSWGAVDLHLSVVLLVVSDLLRTDGVVVTKRYGTTFMQNERNTARSSRH